MACCCFQIDSYGGSLKYKVRYTLARGMSEAVERSDVILLGNGRRLVYRPGGSTPARVVNQKEITFTEVGGEPAEEEASRVCEPACDASRITGNIPTAARRPGKI